MDVVTRLDELVEDVLSEDVVELRHFAPELAEHEIEAPIVEKESLDEVVVGVVRRGLHGVEIRARIVEPFHPEMDVGQGFGQPDSCPQDVAERAVGVRQRMEQVRMLVVGGAGHDAAAGQEHVGLDQSVVHEAVPEAGRFDADADGGAADRDVLELGRDERQETARQAIADDRLERCEPLDVERALLGVERDDFVEGAERQPPFALAAIRVTEQVRDRRLGEPELARFVTPGGFELGFLPVVSGPVRAPD